MMEEIPATLWRPMMAMRSEPWLAEFEEPPAMVSPARA
jgi:hypothetical protein